MIAELRGALALCAESDPGMQREIRDAFARRGASCLDLDPADPRPALAAAQEVGRVDTLIVGRPMRETVGGIEDFTDENLATAVTGGAGLLFTLMRRIKDALGSYPRYVIGLSSPAPDHLAPGDDLRAVGDAALETLCRYASYRLLYEDVRVNVIRYRPLPSDFALEHTPAHFRATAMDVANATVALSSGLMDSVRGQVITVDRGATFRNNSMGLYNVVATLTS